MTTIVPAVQRELCDAALALPRAAGVVLDPRSGAVLAIASVPSFDPNGFDAKFTELRGRRSPLLDRALDGLYPPGSTFKISRRAAALDAGTVRWSRTFDDPGYFTIGDFTCTTTKARRPGYARLAGAFALSSNVDFAQIALEDRRRTWYDNLRAGGIGDRSTFSSRARATHSARGADRTPGELAQLGFGQADLLVTPLRMALIGATIADGGNEPRPYLVRQILATARSPHLRRRDARQRRFRPRSRRT